MKDIHHAVRVRRIFLRTPKDCSCRLSLCQLQEIPIALSLVANNGYWTPLDIMAFCGLPLPTTVPPPPPKPPPTPPFTPFHPAPAGRRRLLPGVCIRRASSSSRTRAA
jgi:hypothetical protein